MNELTLREIRLKLGMTMDEMADLKPFFQSSLTKLAY